MVVPTRLAAMTRAGEFRGLTASRSALFDGDDIDVDSWIDEDKDDTITLLVFVQKSLPDGEFATCSGRSRNKV